MNNKKAKQLKSEYSAYCLQCKQPESRASWRRFKKYYTKFKEQFLK